MSAPSATARRTFRHPRGFTRAQQPRLRLALAAAWEAHRGRAQLAEDAGARCRRGPRCKLPECPYCAWYEATLLEATGQRSTTDCNAGRDYDALLARLEIIAGTGISAQLAKSGGDATRILHAVAEVWPEHDLDEKYLRRIAFNALRSKGAAPAGLPELAALDADTIALVRNAAVAHARRKANQPF